MQRVFAPLLLVSAPSRVAVVVEAVFRRFWQNRLRICTAEVSQRSGQSQRVYLCRSAHHLPAAGRVPGSLSTPRGPTVIRGRLNSPEVWCDSKFKPRLILLCPAFPLKCNFSSNFLHGINRWTDTDLKKVPVS